MNERGSANNPSTEFLDRCKEYQKSGDTVELEYGGGRNRVTGTINNVYPDAIELDHNGKQSLFQWWTIDVITLLPAAASVAGTGR